MKIRLSLRRHPWSDQLKRRLKEASQNDNATDKLHLPTDLTEALAQLVPTKSIADESANNILRIITFRTLTEVLSCLVREVNKDGNQPLGALLNIGDFWREDSAQYNIWIHNLLLNTANQYREKTIGRMLMAAAQLVKMSYPISENELIIDDQILDYLTELAIVLCYAETEVGTSAIAVIVHQMVAEITASSE